MSPKQRRFIWLVVLVLVPMLGCICALAEEPSPQARAALALALAASPATESQASPVPRAPEHPVTCPASDGGPDWVWDAERGVWYRWLPRASPVVRMPPPAPVAFPIFFPARFRGGACFGGG